MGALLRVEWQATPLTGVDSSLEPLTGVDSSLEPAGGGGAPCKPQASRGGGTLHVNPSDCYYYFTGLSIGNVFPYM